MVCPYYFMNEYFLIYFLGANLITAIITAYDKLAAKKLPKRRIPEKTLFILAFLGGSLGEYLTMKLIRHKTKHKKFMIGLPAVIILQAGLMVFVVLLQNGIIKI